MDSALEFGEFLFKERMFCKRGVGAENLFRGFAGGGNERWVHKGFHCGVGEAGLRRAEEFARTPVFQVVFRKLETVLCGDDCLKAGGG